MEATKPSNTSISVDLAEILRDVWAQGGSFAAGWFIGSLVAIAICYGTFRLISKERREQAKIDFKREQELYKQLDIKEQRITALHKLLGKNKDDEQNKPEE